MFNSHLISGGPGVSKSVTPTQTLTAPSKGGGKVGGKTAAAIASDKDKQIWSNPAAICIDKFAVPTVQEAQFLYNACLCASQLIVNQVKEIRLALMVIAIE